MSGCSAVLGIQDPEIEGSILPGVDASPGDGPISSGDGSSTADGGDASRDGTTSGDAGVAFVDDFNRPEGGPGNGWIEKAPAGTWLTVGGRLLCTKPAPLYLDEGLYRPFSEALLDVEVAVAFKLSALPPGFVQVHARVPQSAITTIGQSDGYSIYIPNSSTEARLFRLRGSTPTDLKSLTLSEALNTTDSYRMRLRVTGTNPVALEGWVERFTNPGFVVIGHGTTSDSDATRFDQAGTVNLALDANANASYDDFTRTPVSVP